MVTAGKQIASIFYTGNISLVEINRLQGKQQQINESIESEQASKQASE